MRLKWLRSTTLQTQILTMVAISTMIVLTGAGIRMDHQAKGALSTTKDVYSTSLKTTVVGQMDLIEKSQVDAFYRHVLMGATPEIKAKLKDELAALQKKFVDVLNSSTMSFEDSNLDASVTMMKKHQEFVKSIDNAIDLYFDKKTLSPSDAAQVLVPSEKAITQALGDLQVSMLDVIGKQVQESENSIKKSLYTSLGAAAGIAFLVFGLITLILRSVNSKFVQIVSQLTEASGQIYNASSGMLENAENLSKAVNQQASSVQQTMASMTEMSSMLSQSSTTSANCRNLSKEAAEKAKAGKEIMQDMGNSMSSIESANAQLQNMIAIIHEITSKTNIINDIVFKTQLLSFNASIEAERAGQHGRGFAVIADEVGSLSQLSGDASKEIAALLENSKRDVEQILSTTSERVKEGRVVLNRAIKTFNEIAGDVQNISNQSQIISDATKEQEDGIKQTSLAIGLIDKATHQSATVAQQAQQASISLGDQSNRIVEISSAIRNLIIGKKKLKTTQSSEV